MKEFVINDRKLSSVECDTPWLSCPVFKMVFDVNKERSVFATTYKSEKTNGIRMEVLPEKVCDLKANVMNMCMDCNVKER